MKDDEFKNAITKLEHFCAYQERCTLDVIKKMSRIGVEESHHSQLIQYLRDSNFLDDERYTRNFISSKLLLKRDGIQKITYALRAKNISSVIIETTLRELDKEQYQSNLLSLIEKKWSVLIQKNEYPDAKTKLTRFLLSKGYKYDEISPAIKHLNPKL